MVLSHNTQSTTRETPFNLVYGIDALIPIEIVEPTPHTYNFSHEDSKKG